MLRTHPRTPPPFLPWTPLVLALGALALLLGFPALYARAFWQFYLWVGLSLLAIALQPRARRKAAAWGFLGGFFVAEMLIWALDSHFRVTLKDLYDPDDIFVIVYGGPLALGAGILAATLAAQYGSRRG